MIFPEMEKWGRIKGIDLLATGDWTHPLWFREIETNLVEMGNGLLRLKSEIQEKIDANAMIPPQNKNRFTRFLLASEVSSIYKQNGKLRRVHTLLWVPTLASARKINQELTKRGCNLMSDGRPIIGLTCIQIAELVLSIEPTALIIPAHAWTPWFAVYGSLGGFDSIAEAFGQYADRIYAIETGLSSNPSMNWRVGELDDRSIVSFSDAHSGPKLGREATIFHTKDSWEDFSYTHVVDAIKEPFFRSTKNTAGQKALTDTTISYTLEFYPEEGKYHYTGHRSCNVRQSPEETQQKGETCPVCGKRLTVGVMERIEALATRSEASVGLTVTQEPLIDGGAMLAVTRSSLFPKRPAFTMLVPLAEIIAESLDVSTASKKVWEKYFSLVKACGGEFTVLLKTPVSEIAAVVGSRIAEGVVKVRTGDLVIDPGYDGVFGVVKLWKHDGDAALVDESKEQLALL